ncbi:MAG: cytochrome c oxidase assembly protein [Acidobacteria bacterium]|nr:cytochrome c oxidase assembly protein [Acidobacteriota bacterium]
MPPFALHPAWLGGLAVLAALHVGWVRERRYRVRALWGWLVLAVVVLWPVGDLAASVSLSVATLQRLVIMLLVAPLFVKSVSTAHFVVLTRPTPIDALTRRLAHPALAMAVVTLVGTLTLSTPVVDAGAHSEPVRALTLVGVLACGVILWIPALGVMPGARRLSPIGRAGFIFVASLVVTSLSFVWIFARHSLYPDLHHQESLLHMTPLFDQQLAGFVAKIGSYVPMWAVAFTIFSRADDAGVAVEESPLHWADVERQLLRIDRQRDRTARRSARRRGAAPDAE